MGIDLNKTVTLKLSDVHTPLITSAGEAEVGESLSSRLVLSTEQVQGPPELLGETQSQEKPKQKNKP